MIVILGVILIDTALVKVYDIVDKNFIPANAKLGLFVTNSSLCLIIQYFILNQVRSSFKFETLNRALKIRPYYSVALVSLLVLGGLMGCLMFQVLFFDGYVTTISILIILISYGIGAFFLVRLALLFYSWYRSNRNLIVLLYFISIAGIAFNLLMTATFAAVKVSDKPYLVQLYLGGGGGVSGGKHILLDTIYRISSFISFFSIWVTTAIIMNSYREKLMNTIVFWLILSIPLIYFLTTYFYQYILTRTLISYLEIDPVMLSIVLSAFLSLSRPIGGLMFGLVFWNISNIVRYEKNIKTYMFISGWGIFLIFAANQATLQMVTPFPPFGLATITVISLAAYLMLLGIYGSAVLVSANTNLRRFIHKHALESRLLNLIGHAEFENEIQKTVTKINQDKLGLEMNTETRFELDEIELKRYLDIVIKETKKQEGETGTNS